MPRPALTRVQIRQLHKRKGNKDACTVHGTDVAVGNPVSVTGTHGSHQTHWIGTITRDHGNGSYDSTDLTVDREQQGPGIRTGGGTEDVSVTVSNGDGPSAPAPAPAVPVVP